MCLEYRVVIVCLCTHIYALYQLYVCVFVYFKISQHCFLLFHLLKYYCIVFNHCVRKLYVCVLACHRVAVVIIAGIGIKLFVCLSIRYL